MEKVPTLVVIFLTAAGWVVTHIVDRVLNSPTVEYAIEQIDIKKDGGSSVAQEIVHLENLSANMSFNGLEFALRPKRINDDLLFINDASNGFISEIRPYAPVWPGDMTVTTEEKGVKYTIGSLPPRGKIDLIAYFHGTVAPELVSYSTGPVMVLLPPSIETFFARHEACVLIAAVIIGGIAMFLAKPVRVT